MKIDTELRLLILAGVAALVLVVGVIELSRETRKVAAVVAKADVSAAEISALLREAREITEQAARGN